MDVKEALHRASHLRNQAWIAAAECQERSARLVTAEVTYHMPDSPHVLNTFIWQKEDRFDAGDKIIGDLNNAKNLFQITEGHDDISTAFNSAMTFYQATVKQAWGHLEKVTRTSDHFDISMSDHGRNLQSHLANEVPFPALRKFINFWLSEIEGPANYIKVTHTAMMTDHAGLTSFKDNKALIM